MKGPDGHLALVLRKREKSKTTLRFLILVIRKIKCKLIKVKKIETKFSFN